MSAYNAAGSFARKQLEKHGWTEGSGLGSSQQGISQALRVKIKHDTAGVGHDLAKEFTDFWWERAFNKAAANLVVENTEDGVVVKSKKETQKERTATAKKTLYSNFIKGSLLSDGTETRMPKEEDDSSDSSEDDTSHKASILLLPDDELLKICRGRTCHPAARFGLRMTGKLSRLQKEELRLAAERKNHNSSSSSSPASQSHSVELPLSDTAPSKKRSKKRKREEEEQEERAEGDDIMTRVRVTEETDAPLETSEAADDSVSKRKKKKKREKERAEKDREEKEERIKGDVDDDKRVENDTTLQSSSANPAVHEDASGLSTEGDAKAEKRRKEKKKRKKERREDQTEVDEENKGTEENESGENGVRFNTSFPVTDEGDMSRVENGEDTRAEERRKKKKKRRKERTENENEENSVSLETTFPVTDEGDMSRVENGDDNETREKRKEKKKKRKRKEERTE